MKTPQCVNLCEHVSRGNTELELHYWQYHRASAYLLWHACDDFKVSQSTWLNDGGLKKNFMFIP